MTPLVSVITPTWNRHDLLLERCIPSVAAQIYPNVEHVIVSDGPDAELYDKLCSRSWYGVRFAAMPYHDDRARWGHWARLAGIELAAGSLIAYLDDDNAYRPDHLQLLVDALISRPEVDFAYSRMLMHIGNGAEIGADPPVYGQVDTSLLLHWRELLDVETWSPSLPSIDWDLVFRWMRAGRKWVHVPRVTLDYYK